MAFLVPSTNELKVWKVDSDVHRILCENCKDQEYCHQYSASKQRLYQAVLFFGYQSVLHEVACKCKASFRLQLCYYKANIHPSSGNQQVFDVSQHRVVVLLRPSFFCKANQLRNDSIHLCFLLHGNSTQCFHLKCKS